MSQHQQHVEDAKGGCGDGEKINGHEILGMIIEEGPPGLGRWLSVPDPILGDRGLGDLDAEHLKLPVQARCTPEGILAGQAANQIAHLA